MPTAKKKKKKKVLVIRRLTVFIKVMSVATGVQFQGLVRELNVKLWLWWHWGWTFPVTQQNCVLLHTYIGTKVWVIGPQHLISIDYQNTWMQLKHYRDIYWYLNAKSIRFSSRKCEYVNFGYRYQFWSYNAMLVVLAHEILTVIVLCCMCLILAVKVL